MKAVVMAFAVLLLPLAAAAQDMETWDFGRVPFGDFVGDKPDWAQDWSCQANGECTFRDGQGVDYLAQDGEIVSKTFDFTSRGAGPAPFGIPVSGDSKAALAAIGQQVTLYFSCDTHDSNASMPPDARYCTAEVEPDVEMVVAFGADDKPDWIRLSAALM